MQATIVVKGKAIDPSECVLSFATRSYPGAEPHSIPYYDDGFGTLWIMRDSMGIVGIVRADSYSDAYSCVGDELRTPIEPGDVPEAYGAFDKMHDWMVSRGHEDTLHLRKFCSSRAPQFFAAVTSGNGDNKWPTGEDIDLVEGYEYQDNASGTGIVSIDLNGEALEPLTAELIERLGIEVTATFGE